MQVFLKVKMRTTHHNSHLVKPIHTHHNITVNYGLLWEFVSL